MEELFSETVTLSSSEPISTLGEPPEPKTIGSGIVTSVLGKGGAAVIYDIWNPKLEIHRAVKLWRPTLSDKIISRFEAEMKITAKLRHPNIVEIHSVGEWNGLPFIEIEKIDGYSLKELLQQKGGSLPVPVTSAVAICICRALTYAHNHEYVLTGKKFRGVIHCDIKPANIMVAKDGTVKLTDFGIALPSKTTGSSDKNKITGSLQYMSPEQLTSSEVDVRTDIFSLGIVLYEVFSGVKAFPANTLETLIEKRKKNILTPINSFGKNLPPKVSQIVHKCIEVNPENRYQDVAELMQDLEKLFFCYTTENPEKLINRYLAGSEIPARMIRRDGATLKRALLISVLLVGIGALTALVFFIKENKIITFVNKPLETLSRQNVVKSESLQHPDVKTIDEKKEGVQTVDNDVTEKSAAKGVVPVLAKKMIRKKDIEKTLITSKVPDHTKSAELVSNDVILDELWKLVRSNESKNADRMFAEFPINDAEYFLAFAEFQLRRGNFAQAEQQAKKAMQTTSKRIDVNQIRMRSFFLKAKALSGEYEQAPDRTKAQAAMEAWYDVKFQYRSETSNANYIEADKEIRRISAGLQQ